MKIRFNGVEITKWQNMNASIIYDSIKSTFSFDMYWDPFDKTLRQVMLPGGFITCTLVSSVFGMNDGNLPFAIPARQAGIGGSYFVIPKISVQSASSSTLKLAGSIDKGKQMPCEICPRRRIVLILMPLGFRNSNSGLSGMRLSTSQYTTKSPSFKIFNKYGVARS